MKKNTDIYYKEFFTEEEKKKFRKRWFRWWDMYKNYGLSKRNFLQMKAEQGGKCAICGKPGDCIDHCHETGKVRGLLCSKCNVALGGLKTIENLAKAIAYLQKNGNGNALVTDSKEEAKKQVPGIPKPIIERIDPITGEVVEYKSYPDLQKEGFIPHMVSKVIRGVFSQHHGYVWALGMPEMEDYK